MFPVYPAVHPVHFELTYVLLDHPKNMLEGVLPLLKADLHTCYNWKQMYRQAEMQLSLMHDVLYSKAELIHTCTGSASVCSRCQPLSPRSCCSVDSVRKMVTADQLSPPPTFC
jgi:hypothetical protein